MVNIDICFKGFWVCTILPVIKCPKKLGWRGGQQADTRMLYNKRLILVKFSNLPLLYAVHLLP